jgi:hypothetical protein
VHDAPSSYRLNERARGWLRHLWRKATTPDDWSRGGEPHAWWDRKSVAPMLSFPRFDLSESAYGLLLMADATPAWREVYTRILDELVRRHTTYWAAVDWLTQIGPDPDRARYPKRYKALVPKDLWGRYDAPGWTANGVEPWGLQPDPIASDGFLFFRGFLTLLLGIHRAVSGAATWERPFEMTGLDDRTFPWTHSGIAGYLAEQWERVPEGPHCENTKVWPYCLSAAGLGLQLTDETTGSRTHHVYDRWAGEVFPRRYLEFSARGKLRSVALYYDPLLGRTHGRNRILGLFPAFYVLPQNRQLAELLYRNAVASVGWDRRWLPVVAPPGREPRALSLALLLAREFGDQTTERRLARKLAGFEGGRFFESDGAGEGDEFGFFFRYGEPYPRGQESALLALRELLHGEGAWERSFRQRDRDRFAAPTVEGVEYPKLGLSAASNDAASGVLRLETYVATRAERGAATKLRVARLPNPAAASVIRDGDTYARWRTVAPDAIEIETEVADHRFEVHTGVRGRPAPPPDAPRSAARLERSAATAVAPRASLRPIELAAAGVALRAGVGCPCCG